MGIKTTPILLLLLINSNNLIANDHSVFNQMVAVNKQWLYQADVNPSLRVLNATYLEEQQLVQLHLKETENLLRSRSTDNLTAEQKSTRAKLLDMLHSYWVRGVFPKNTFHKERRPYFIDIYNNYCAVGYLMKISGADRIARDINAKQNFHYLKDITHSDLVSWISRSGFTTNELALIQPSYGCYPTSIVEMHYNNAGPDVNEFIEINYGMAVGIGNYTGSPSRIEFYDNTGILYKTLPVGSLQNFCVNYGPNAGAVGCGCLGYCLYMGYYLFPANESFADEGTIKLINTTAGIDYNIAMYVYNSSGINVTYYSTFLPTSGQPQGPPVFYPVSENGSTAAGISLNFCSSFCSPVAVNYFADLLPATYGSANANCFRILPVTLIDFDFTIINGKINVNWNVLNESNMDKYEVERSDDGILYTSIGMVKSLNNSAGQAYVYKDQQPKQRNYYRLKQINVDGKFAYSKVLIANLKLGKPLTVLQNPANDKLVLRINVTPHQIKLLEVFDLTGKSVMQLKPVSGLNTINISGFARGQYYLRLTTREEGSYSLPFVTL